MNKEIDKIEIKVNKYEALPHQKKLPEVYNSIKKRIDDVKDKIKETEDKLVNPVKYTDEISFDELDELDDSDKFIIYLDQVEGVKKKLDKEGDLDKQIKLYLELHSLLDWCRSYLENRKFDIIEV